MCAQIYDIHIRLDVQEQTILLLTFDYVWNK
jgi:hypothetical protein